MIKKVAGVIVILLVLIGIYLIVKPKTSRPMMKQSAHPTPITQKLRLDIKNNKLTTQTNKFTYSQGDILEITITADTDQEVHFHGYDKKLNTRKDQPVKLEFTLDTAGNFPFELEETSTELGTLIVQPK